jgi:predicted P-loop ATPase
MPGMLMHKYMKKNEASINKAEKNTIRPPILNKTPGKTITITEDEELTPWQKVENFISKNYILQNNEVSNRVEYKKVGEKSEFKELNAANLYRDLKKARKNISMTDLYTLLSSDFVEIVNPFKNYFNSLRPWKENDPDHIEKLANYVILKNDEERKEFNHQFTKMLVRTVKCAIVNTYYNKHAFVLVGPDQHTGKSTFLRFLCPETLADYYSESITFSEKDNLIALSENFIINIDELSALFKNEINSLKSYFSKDRVKARHPYDRKSIVTPRRVSFVASTNKSEFLGDETGSVRWICFDVTGIDFNNKEKGNYTKSVSIDAVWSQAYYLLNNSFDCDLTAEEIIRNGIRNKVYQFTTIEIELIQKYFTPGAAREGDHTNYFTATEIGDELKFCSMYMDYKVNIINIGKALAFLGFEKVCTRLDSGTTKKGYYVNYKRPLKKEENIPS